MTFRRLTFGLSAFGAFLYGLGTTLNDTVVFFNNQEMPVKAAQCVANPHILDNDSVHGCMTAATHLKFLCDWIHIGRTIYSLGDLGLYVGAALVSCALPLYIYSRFRNL